MGQWRRSSGTGRPAGSSERHRSAGARPGNAHMSSSRSMTISTGSFALSRSGTNAGDFEPGFGLGLSGGASRTVPGEAPSTVSSSAPHSAICRSGFLSSSAPGSGEGPISSRAYRPAACATFAMSAAASRAETLSPLARSR